MKSLLRGLRNLSGPRRAAILVLLVVVFLTWLAVGLLVAGAIRP